jgi:anti-anti-sigma regulatory factor
MFGAAREYSIAPDGRCFAHPDACQVSSTVLRAAGAAGTDVSTVVIDLSRAADATTSAFARLVLLRRELLRRGRDLRLVGLRDRAARLYEVSRLEAVLPRC